METKKTPPKGIRRRREWVPAALIVLSLVPVAAGMARLTQLGSGGPITAENSRFFASGLPVIVHIVGATAYSLFGALQFSAGLRRRAPVWHRLAGRFLAVCGVAVALSGLWMTQFYPIPEALQGPLLRAVRYLVGLAMLAALGLGIAAIARRNVAAHEAWMMRAYGLALGAGTQVLTALPWMLAAGPPPPLVREILLIAGWLINAAVVEVVLRRRKITSKSGARNRAPV
jgi:hypothetical protein